jgi:MurNAc alpha-1-phosphate uridylyltransferase
MLKVAGKPLIEHQINRLVAAGIREIVINHAYLGEQIEAYLGDGAQLDCHIQYSAEPEPLETGGGIFKALPLLGDEPFLLVNGDIWLDMDYGSLVAHASSETSEHLAHLILVNNPEHNPNGDFYLHQGWVSENAPNLEATDRYTFSGVSILYPELFTGCSAGVFKLAPLLKAAMDPIKGEPKVTGQVFNGYWLDVGTPERLAALENHLSQ